MREAVWYSSFWPYFILLGTMSSRLVSVIANDKIPSLWLKNIPLCICTFSNSIHQLMDSRLFPYLSLNGIAINVDRKVLPGPIEWISFWSSGAGITAGFEPPAVGAQNWTQVFIYVYFYPLEHGSSFKVLGDSLIAFHNGFCFVFLEVKFTHCVNNSINLCKSISLIAFVWL